MQIKEVRLLFAKMSSAGKCGAAPSARSYVAIVRRRLFDLFLSTRGATRGYTSENGSISGGGIRSTFAVARSCGAGRRSRTAPRALFARVCRRRRDQRQACRDFPLARCPRACHDRRPASVSAYADLHAEQRHRPNVDLRFRRVRFLRRVGHVRHFRGRHVWTRLRLGQGDRLLFARKESRRSDDTKGAAADALSWLQQRSVRPRAAPASARCRLFDDADDLRPHRRKAAVRSYRGIARGGAACRHLFV